MIGKKTSAALKLLKIMLVLWLVFLLTLVPVAFAIQFGVMGNLDPEDPNVEQEIESAVMVFCLFGLIFGLLALAILGLMIATGIMMILSHNEHDELRITGIASGVMLLSSIVLVLFTLIPFIGFIISLLVSFLVFGSMILYLYSLCSRKGRMLLYATGGLLGSMTLLGTFNNFYLTFIHSGDELPSFMLIISGIMLIIYSVGIIMLIRSIGIARTDHESSAEGFFKEAESSNTGSNRVHGRVQPAKEGWLDYGSADNSHGDIQDDDDLWN